MFVHVSDLAHAHVLALKTPPTKEPKRCIVAGGTFTWRAVIDLISQERPGLKGRLPNRDDANSSNCATLDTSSARDILGMKQYKDWREAVLDAVDDLVRMEAKLGIKV